MVANLNQTEVSRKLGKLEERLEVLGRRVKTLEHLRAELDDVRRTLGTLKVEVEEFREGD